MLDAPAVLADRHARVVGREHQRDDPGRAVGERLLDRLRDPRAPVLHPHVDGQAELSLEALALALGDRLER